MWWKALWSVHLWPLALSHNPTATAAVITLRGAALSYRTLPERNDCNVFEKKPIEGLVFLNWLYLSALIKLNKYCKPPLNLLSAKFNHRGVWVVKYVYSEKYLTFMVGALDGQDQLRVQLTGGCCRWMYPVIIRRPIWAISLSSVFPGLPGVLCQAFNLSSRFTTPSKIWNTTKDSVQRLDMFPHLAAATTT